MGLPAKKRTKSSKRRRASHFALKHRALTVCSHCRKAILPHRVCPHCGYYRGRQVIKLKSALDKKSKAKGKKKDADDEKAAT
jgi:large subunit ribosomal protein L32